MSIRQYILMTFLFLLVFCAGVRAQDILSGSSGGFSLTWTAGDIRITPAGDAAREISFRHVAQEEWNKLVQDAGGESLSGDTAYRVLSFVGPYLSVETGQYCDCGGAHPTAHRQFQAIDLRGTGPERPKPLMLTELFPEKAILAALKADKVIAAALKEAQAPPPQSLAALVNAVKYQPVHIGDCAYSLSEYFLSEFSLYDVKANKVAVRISVSHAAEVCRGQMTQIGIELQAPDGLTRALQEAKARSSGFLMIDAAKLAGNKDTSFHFSTAGDRGRQ
jgi:hypothetical protein